METDMEIDDDCGEYEEEEFLVYVDIEPTSLNVEQISEAKTLKMFGLDTKKPLLQINNQFYEGKVCAII
jgi:TFIIIC subunit triple barrel domain